MKKIILQFIMLALLWPTASSAYDFSVDGVFYNLNGDEATVTAGDYSYSGMVVIPPTVTYDEVTLPVTTIDSKSFFNCTDLQGIQIPPTIKVIEDSAFYGCRYVYVNIADIGAWCNIEFGDMYANPCIFHGSFNLNGRSITNLVIPETVTEIKDYAFMGCNYITSVVIPEGVTRIGLNAFHTCSRLTSIVIPESVTEFGPSVFVSCRSLVDITLPPHITSIPENLLLDCEELPSINIPNGVVSIGERAFDSCFKLDSVLIPESVTSIGYFAFSACRALSSLRVAEGNPVYDSRDNCNAIIETATNMLHIGTKATVIPNTVTEVGTYSFYGCYSLPAISFPPSVTTISHQAFSYCHALTSIKIPNTITSIPGACFMGCSRLERVVLPETLTWLGAMAFQDCKSLKEVFCHCPTPPDPVNSLLYWLSDPELIAGRTLYVPAGSKEAYASQPNWAQYFGRIVEMGNEFHMSDTTVMRGDVISIPVRLTNSDTFMAFQTDVYLPEGFTLVTDENEDFVVTPSNRLSSNHVIISDLIDNGSAVRVICYTIESIPFTGHEGDLFYLNVKVPEDAGGDYTIKLKNSRLTDTEYGEVRVPDTEAVITVQTYMPGDANDSRSVTVTDVVVTAQYLLQRNPDPFVFDAADMNGDGEISVTDIMLIANLVMGSSMNMPRRVSALPADDYSMSGEVATLTAGETCTISVDLTNVKACNAFQLDLNLPENLTASNFALTGRASGHELDVQAFDDGKVRVLCYSTGLEVIEGYSGALLTFDLTANAKVDDNIIVDGIELVTADFQTVSPSSFAIAVKSPTAITETQLTKSVAHIDYYNLSGQQLTQPAEGINIVVTTYSDGTRSIGKMIQ